MDSRQLRDFPQTDQTSALSCDQRVLASQVMAEGELPPPAAFRHAVMVPVRAHLVLDGAEQAAHALSITTLASRCPRCGWTRLPDSAELHEMRHAWAEENHGALIPVADAALLAGQRFDLAIGLAQWFPPGRLNNRATRKAILEFLNQRMLEQETVMNAPRPLLRASLTDDGAVLVSLGAAAA